MTTKHLTGAYPGGYTLSAAYGRLVVESTAFVGGTGILATAAATIQNFGTVDTAGPYGVTLKAGGSVINGSASDRVAQIQGVLASYGPTAAVANYGTIAGRRGGVVLQGGGTVTNGSETDRRAVIVGAYGGVSIDGGVSVVANFGTIEATRYAGVRLGGNGGSVTNGSADDSTARISGATGVTLGGSTPQTIDNFGAIVGTGGRCLGIYNPLDRVIAEAGSRFVGATDGARSTLELAGGAGTISGLGASGAITGAVTATINNFGVYQIDAGGSWTLEGTNGLNAGRSLIDDGVITNEGALTLDWTVSGAGVLDIAGGTAVIETGAAIETRRWSLTGGATAVNEFLDYSGAFTEAAGATLTVAAGQKLILLGASSLAGTIDGAVTARHLTLGDLTVGGTLQVKPGGRAVQAGTVTLGDAGGGAARLVVGAGALYTMDGAVGVARGGAGPAALEVFGTLVRSGAAGTSLVAVKAIDRGTIEAAAGVLEFAGRLAGTGSLTIDAGATLQADSKAAAGLTVDFAGPGATLALGAPAAFAATLAGLAPGDTLHLIGQAATGAAVNGADQLVIIGPGGTLATLQLSGDYTGDSFSAASDGAGGTDITVSTGARAAPPHALIAAAASLGARAGPVHAALAVHADVPRFPLASPRTQIA